jgi:hypothetical protein
METQEVARSDWSSFFGAFSRQHESWLVTLEEIPGSASRAFLEAGGLALEGILADPHTRAISIMLGRLPDRHITHTIDRPARVLVERTEDGIEQAVRIERDEGRVTRLSFRSAVRPEEVDGIV